MYTLQIKTDSKNKIIHLNEPGNLAQVLVSNGIFIDRACSGKGTCGKCAVRFVSGAPSPNNEDENIFNQKELDMGCRLSCKCTVSQDAVIEITERASYAAVEHGISGINELYLLDHSLKEGYGIAVDLGTTTIVVYLTKLSDGRILGAKSGMNPQRQYGDNVITRSEYINSHENGLNELRLSAIGKINELTDALADENKIDKMKIFRAAISGNTIMQHILCGVNPFPITVAPYAPVFTEQQKMPASVLRLNIMPDAECIITNSISGYVGGDIVSGILAVGMDKDIRTSLLIDIGTNGEMVLSHKGKMYACSVAAGPAFEGEHIKYGVGGIKGAISKAYSVDGQLAFDTIGNSSPVGICGSGLLDITAFLIDSGILDSTGSMDEEKCGQADGETAYYITEDIYISQKDIREIQLAKSAVAAGAEVLIHAAGIGFDDVENVYLSGGFGTYLNIKSAVKIGLINRALESKCISAGNTAGMGSIKSLLSDNVLQSLAALTQKVEYIELSFNKSFNDLFIENMLF
ncbi:MAG: DUF4445 domain-containing protein [Clostridia bacterium]|nr:DUF4445 domain-containing protein [Clostridia bacterium]